MRFRYQLTGAGWSELLIESEGASVSVSGSYLSDALGDFVEATRTLLAGADESRCSFAEEPGEFRWIFRRVGSDQVHISVRWFDKLWGNQPDQKGRVLFEAVLQAATFGRKVLQMAEDLRTSMGEAAYLEQWGAHPYPSQGVTGLREILSRKKAAEPGATDNPDDAQ